MSKHTPGPWHVHEDHSDLVIDSRWIRLAAILGDTPARRAADARLIAAAPEMLGVLEDLMDDYCFDFESEYADILERALDVIAKARGES